MIFVAPFVPLLYGPSSPAVLVGVPLGKPPRWGFSLAVLAMTLAAEVVVDVVGPVCETGDFLALDRPLPDPREGEVLACRTSGAYGFTMASNYNGRLRPAEVLVDGTDIRLVRRRETYQDLTRGEE